MGFCRGNLGNLMQHWVLSETLAESGRQVGDRHLLLTTTHSMAPWSTPRALANANLDYSRPRFDAARNRLGVGNLSVYERAWSALSSKDGLPYPSSALFASHIWNGPLSLVLCEFSDSVAKEIQEWLVLPEIRSRLSSRPESELHQGDWRERFRRGFTIPSGVQAFLVEMDPMRFEHHGQEQCSRGDGAVLYIEDLDIVAAALAGIGVPLVVQVSSFSANNNNPHRIVEPTISRRFAQVGLELRGKVEADGNMISLVYSRGLALWSVPDMLSKGFAAWAHNL